MAHMKIKNRNGERMRLNRIPIQPKKSVSLLKLDLSFGDPPPGFQFVRHPFDPITTQPWPLDDESVEEVYSAFLFNRIPGKERFKFMEEMWRVLIPGGKATVIVPYWTSYRSIQDPFTEFPPLAEQSFLYFNKQFRESNRLPYVAKCDFDFVYGYTLDQETQVRPDDSRQFWIKHYTNAVSDLQVVLTKRPATHPQAASKRSEDGNPQPN